MTFNQIVDLLNELSVGYKFGELQSWRQKNNGLKRSVGNKIFRRSTTKEKYAFHYGGRKEIQFNIGYDLLGKFRYGVAFSLEKSRFFNDFSPFYPKIERYNDYFLKNRSMFESYSGFTQKKGVVVSEYAAKVIPKEEYTNQNRTFFFIGKYIEKNIADFTHDDCHIILKTFDDLLDLYLYVESK